MWRDEDTKLMRRVIVFLFIAAIFTVLALVSWFAPPPMELR